MAKAKPAEEPEVKPVEEAPPPSRPNKLYILIGGVAVVLFQAMLLTLIMHAMIPAPAQLPPILNVEMPPEGVIITQDPTIPTFSRDETEEHSLGGKLGDKYKTIDFDSQKRTIEFEVTITALVNKKDNATFTKLVEARQNSIREAIFVVLRSAEQDERSSPDLRELKAKIKKRVNEVLEKPYIIDIIMTDPKCPLPM